MKLFKILLVCSLAFTFVGENIKAQTSGTTYTLPTGVTSYTAFSLTHTNRWADANVKDSIGGTATKYWTFAVNKSNLYFYQFLTEYDTLLTKGRAVGNHVTVWLQGSIDGTYFINIDSVLFHPTGQWLPATQTTNATVAAIGVAGLKDVSTGVLWRYLRVKAVGGDANKCALITKLMVKVGLKNGL